MANPEKISYLLQDMQTRLSGLPNRSGVQNFKLLGLPSIIYGEAFSSWVWRVTESGYLSRKQLLRKLKIKHRAHWVDGNPDLIDIDLFQKRFNDYSLTSIKSTLIFFHKESSKTKLYCLTTDLLNKRPIYRYCPCCFKEDSIPYIRKNWRLAFSYICPIHYCLLEDSCPKCNSIFNLERTPSFNSELVEDVSMRYCQSCGYDLTKLEQSYVNSEIVDALLKAQTQMMRFVIADLNVDSSIVRLNASELNQSSLNIFEVNELEHYQMTFRHYDGVTAISVIAGLCGPNLFNENTERVGSYFLKNKLFPNTFWFSSNIVYQVYKAKSLKDVIKWLKR